MQKKKEEKKLYFHKNSLLNHLKIRHKEGILLVTFIDFFLYFLLFIYMILLNFIYLSRY
jgi:hypothetical protein